MNATESTARYTTNQKQPAGPRKNEEKHGERGEPFQASAKTGFQAHGNMKWSDPVSRATLTPVIVGLMGSVRCRTRSAPAVATPNFASAQIMLSHLVPAVDVVPSQQ
jgi:hypothetical protein